MIKYSSGKGAVSHAAEEGPRSPTPLAGGSDAQGPVLAAPSPGPTATVDSAATATMRMAFIALRADVTEHGRALFDAVEEATLYAFEELDTRGRLRLVVNEPEPDIHSRKVP